MHLEPVYVSPTAESEPLPTRRAWLVAGGAFVTGAVGAAVGGNLFGSNRSGSVLAGDTEAAGWDLRYLRECCEAATPLARLEGCQAVLLWEMELRHSDDRLLWQGVERLAQAVLEGRTEAAPRMRAYRLLHFLERVQPALEPGEAPVEIDIAGLRSVVEGR